MNILGLDGITFGAEDLAACRRFFLDWGLTLRKEAAGRLEFETLNGCTVTVARSDDPALPEAIESGPTAREVIWGVAAPADLAEVRRAIADRPGFFAEDGAVGCKDPMGVALRFRVSRKRQIDVKGVPVNVWGSVARVNAATTIYQKAEPVELAHIVFFTPSLADMEKFYVGSLGFHVSDRFPGRGVFLRCAENGGHHNLFLLQTGDGRRGLEHVAYAVRDLHELIGGGLNVSRGGWKTELGPGRHPVSSAFFWYVHCPAGGLAEYSTDADFLTGAWRPRDLTPEQSEFAEWAIAGGIDGHTRRQAALSVAAGTPA